MTKHFTAAVVVAALLSTLAPLVTAQAPRAVPAPPAAQAPPAVPAPRAVQAPRAAQAPPAAPAPPATQAPAPAPAPAAPPQPGRMRVAGGGNVPLRVQIVISRYQGEKRISSMPYELSVRTGAGEAALRLGARVPVPTTMFTPPTDGSPAPAAPFPTFNYENVGINIECAATALENGGFDLQIEVNESSAVTDTNELKAITGGDRPIFRSYQSTNTLFMRDGQTAQFTAATDRVTGEIVRVEVKLTVLQ